MENARARKNGTVFLLLSFLLAMFDITWGTLDVRLPSGISSFAVQDLSLFIGGVLVWL